MKTLLCTGLGLALALAFVDSASAQPKIDPKIVKRLFPFPLKADLAVTKVTTCKPYRVYVTVQNKGLLHTRPNLVQLKVYTPTGPYLSNVLKLTLYAKIPSLAPGQSTTVFFNTSPVKLTGGVRLDALVDPFNALAETNEVNNKKVTIIPWFGF